MSSRSPARRAGSRSSTTRSAPTGGAATLVPLDLKDCDGIDRLGAALYERWGKLDILLGNAGILGDARAARPCRPAGLGRGDGGQRHRQLAADPLARPAAARTPTPAGRSSSPPARPASARAYWGAYSVSKAALEALVRTYAAETATTPGAASCSSTPARCAPPCARAAMPGEDPTTLRTPEDLAPHHREAGRCRHGPRRARSSISRRTKVLTPQLPV